MASKKVKLTSKEIKSSKDTQKVLQWFEKRKQVFFLKLVKRDRVEYSEFQDIIHLIEKNQLEEISMRESCDTPEDLESLLQAIFKNPYIETRPIALDIRDNPCNMNCVKLLCAMLDKGKLSSLELPSKLKDKQLFFLLRSVKFSKTQLSILNINGNVMGEKNFDLIKDILTNGKVLSKLYMKDCSKSGAKFTQQDKQILQQAQMTNKKLKIEWFSIDKTNYQHSVTQYKPRGVLSRFFETAMMLIPEDKRALAESVLKFDIVSQNLSSSDNEEDSFDEDELYEIEMMNYDAQVPLQEDDFPRRKYSDKRLVNNNYKSFPSDSGIQHFPNLRISENQYGKENSQSRPTCQNSFVYDGRSPTNHEIQQKGGPIQNNWQMPYNPRDGRSPTFKDIQQKGRLAQNNPQMPYNQQALYDPAPKYFQDSEEQHPGSRAPFRINSATSNDGRQRREDIHGSPIHSPIKPTGYIGSSGPDPGTYRERHVRERHHPLREASYKTDKEPNMPFSHTTVHQHTSYYNINPNQ